MKIIFITLMLLSFLYSDEMQRIEAIVQDITELRAEYEECQDKLENKTKSKISVTTSRPDKYEQLYKKEKQKNIILKAELDFQTDLQKSNKILSSRVKELEKQLLSKNNILKTKVKTKKNQDKICKEVDTFPNLMMKKEYQKKSSSINKIIKFKASPFKLNVDAIVYNSINGKKIDKWSKGRYFTSNKKTSKWIQVTGYFVNKKWRSSKKEMWIKIAQVSKK